MSNAFKISMVFSIFIDDVREKRRYSWNTLQWSKNDIKSNKSTNGDYSCSAASDALMRRVRCIGSKLKHAFALKKLSELQTKLIAKQIINNLRKKPCLLLEVIFNHKQQTLASYSSRYRYSKINKKSAYNSPNNSDMGK